MSLTRLFSLVNDCVNLDMQLTNVSIDEDKRPHIYWKIDPATFPSYLFNNFRVFRSGDGGANWNQITSLTDSAQRDWVGLSPWVRPMWMENPTDTTSKPLSMACNNPRRTPSRVFGYAET